MPSIQDLVHLPALLLLVAANSTPVIVGHILGPRCPAAIDGNRTLRDHRPIFGPHKTWRGLITGIMAAGLVGSLLGTGFAIGALFGSVALAGDLLSSFIKRRLGFSSGQSSLLLDQLPEALLPMLVLREALQLDPLTIVVTALVFTVLDLLTARFRHGGNQ
jgi:hypothetical protein